MAQRPGADTDQPEKPDPSKPAAARRTAASRSSQAKIAESQPEEAHPAPEAANRETTLRAAGKAGAARAAGRTRRAESANSRDEAKTRTRRAVAGSQAPADESRLIAEDRWRLIAEAAYFLAERRGFTPGGEVEDWLNAEQAIDRMLSEQRPG